MISTGDFKRGLRILIDGDPYVILEVHVQSPSARGASSLSKLRVRNLRTAQVLDKTFRGGDKVEQPDLELRPVQFLFRDDAGFHFMDTQSYDQFTLSADVWARRRLPDRYLDGNRSVVFNGNPVTAADGGAGRRHRAAAEARSASATKPIRWKTGLRSGTVVPDSDETVVVDTRDAPSSRSRADQEGARTCRHGSHLQGQGKKRPTAASTATSCAWPIWPSRSVRVAVGWSTTSPTTRCPDAPVPDVLRRPDRNISRLHGGRAAVAPAGPRRRASADARPHVERPPDPRHRRGLGRVEFEGFGVNQEDSRPMFVEAAQAILEGLERGYVEFDGTFVHQRRRELRPRPFKSFRGRTYAAAVSPESSQIMAKLGIGILIIPQKPWDVVATELNDYRQTFHDVNGVDAPPPIVGGWTYCDENADRAAEYARAYIGEYWRSVVRHYELVSDHLATMRGYEAYRTVQELASSPGGMDATTEFFLGLQVWGTPEQCYERILDIQKRTGAEAFNGIFSYGAMPYDLADASVRLFAAEVMPELRKRVPIEDQLIARAGVGSAADASAFRLPI
jgi:translation elongation factor P/translation initiation factor 5A/alkanesulfonate monooxygenase SsuD/methylene tetrahydromethanopterin reductase-like flavin-dependent oxidoreductase (luciferase family)